jgi:phosphoglycerol transferase MdoB-like AlkP superfamily enzyme
VFIVGIMYNTSILEACKITDDVWNKVGSCQKNGFYMNYFINLHYLKVSKPSGYSQERVKKIIEETKSDTANTSQTATGKKVVSNSDFKTNTSLNGKKPNIIYIMNESLADFSKIGTVNYNRDPLEFIHSMKDNTISGLDYVSVFGAGTSNSEFEAMTGNTMKFFPSGCNVYQQFMHDTTYSMSYYLKSLGYNCDAIHPSSAKNWNRINTYNSMKFDKFISIDDFKNPEYIRYISDKESYKKVIELYEKRDKAKPLFLFNVTIQNHGGYLTNTNWKQPIEVEGKYYTEANEYLSSTKESDNAFKYLIDYFKAQKEPTIICMFGDHQPSIETEFYEELLGKTQDKWELSDIQKRYATPFILWANYDIGSADEVVLGNNNLENLLLKSAGIELPVYNKFIEKVSEIIPVMNVNGYMDNNGDWHNYGSDETDEIKKLLDDYDILQYGYYSDIDKQKLFGK